MINQQYYCYNTHNVPEVMYHTVLVKGFHSYSVVQHHRWNQYINLILRYNTLSDNLTPETMNNKIEKE